jgi:hypothetical protein
MKGKRGGVGSLDCELVPASGMDKWRMALELREWIKGGWSRRLVRTLAKIGIKGRKVVVFSSFVFFCSMHPSLCTNN